ncbi:amidohydrolase family protein [Amycolatopsis sp. CA-230715]|uniref:amidohydrolase family protein n=1 Tax=Amycolatopsis sp. CA-230715 TaxID=2745196 RepID=UPI001C0282F4|nr:amidohydrolase family protein [Amycolatopsis sp. CA-230715]QWF83964.1 Melamine deaminase [Amycolatopsis sp. CA-230715]
MSSPKILIRNARILTMDPAIGDLHPGDLLVADGRIAAVAPRLENAERVEEIDATGCIAIPGFVDTHRHMWQAVLRGCAPHHTLRDYFDTILREIGPALTPEDLYLGNLLSARAALDAGITTVQDISNIQDTPAHSDALVQALRDSGSRAVFAYGNSLPRHDAHGSALSPDARRVRTELLPDDEALVTMALLTEPGDEAAERHNADLARDLGLRTARHTVQFSAERPVTRLRELGVLLPGTTFIHGTGLADGELALIAGSGGTLSIAAAIEMMMGHGYPPFGQASGAKLPVSLSTDVEVTAAADMFTQMRAAYQAGRYHELSTGDAPTPNPLTVKEVLRHATLDGATALGLGDRTGSLTPGKEADLVLLRADRPGTAPVHDPYSTVVLQMDRADIDTVLIGGRPVVRHGRSLADSSALVEDARALALRLTAAGTLPD